MVDSDARRDHAAQLEAELVLKQQQHIERLKGLEKDFNLDLDVATDVLGLELLSAEGYGSRKVAELSLLFEVLSSDQKFMFVASVQKTLTPGCYGFGQPETYEPLVDGVLFDCEEPVVIKYSKGTGESGNGSQIILAGNGWELADTARSTKLSGRPIPTLPALDSEPSAHSVTIATQRTPGSFLTDEPYRLDICLTGDDVHDIFNGLNSRLEWDNLRPLKSWVNNWLLRRSG